MSCYQTKNDLTEEQLRTLVLDCDQRLARRMEEVALGVLSVPGLRLIGLTGPTCSGKTTTARLLTEVFEAHGKRVHVVSIDDFYYDKEVLIAKANNNPDVEIDYDSEVCRY